MQFQTTNPTNNMNLKDEIKSMMVDGKFPSYYSRYNREAWEKLSKADVYDNIIRNTLFLPPEEKWIVRIYCIMNGISAHPLCEVCGRNLKFHRSYNKFARTCSSGCQGQLEDVKRKRVETNREKYGADHFQQTDEFKEKTKITCLKKYGVANPMRNIEIQNKVKKTCVEKYGVYNASKSKIVKDKIKQTYQDKYNRDLNQFHISDDSLNKLSNPIWLKTQYEDKKLSASQIAKDLGDVTYAKVLASLRQYDFNIRNNGSLSSVEENEIVDYLKSLGIQNIVRNSRTIISPYELDIYLPDYNLAIEHDGVFYHSFNKPESPIEKRKHLIKTDMCEQLNIQLIHIFENEWHNKQDQIMSMLRAKLGLCERIYARNCSIRELDNITKKNFITQNHIQGDSKSSDNLGLYYSGRLVAVMTFSKNRFGGAESVELVRYCTLKDYTVVGGPSKLFKYYIKTRKVDSIVSYANRRWSKGNMYDALGFSKHVRAIRPNYFYINFTDDPYKLHNRLKFQKHKLPNLLDNFDPTKTEAENMFNAGYRRIWDCGNIKYVWYDK